MIQRPLRPVTHHIKCHTSRRCHANAAPDCSCCSLARSSTTRCSASANSAVATAISAARVLSSTTAAVAARELALGRVLVSSCLCDVSTLCVALGRWGGSAGVGGGKAGRTGLLAADAAQKVGVPSHLLRNDPLPGRRQPARVTREVRRQGFEFEVMPARACKPSDSQLHASSTHRVPQLQTRNLAAALCTPRLRNARLNDQVLTINTTHMPLAGRGGGRNCNHAQRAPMGR